MSEDLDKPAEIYFGFPDKPFQTFRAKIMIISIIVAKRNISRISFIFFVNTISKLRDRVQ